MGKTIVLSRSWHDSSIEGVVMYAPAMTSESIQLSVDGRFDLPAALRLARALSEADEETLVRIDLTRVSQFDDSGVAVLGRALSGHQRADVRGLRQHQVRLLRYLGVEGVGGSIVDAQPSWTS
jgi:ABC-type transporter Mla MlaB component